MDYRAISNKVITNSSFAFEPENPVSTLPKSQSNTADNLQEKILRSQEKINSISGAGKNIKTKKFSKLRDSCKLIEKANTNRHNHSIPSKNIEVIVKYFQRYDQEILDTVVDRSVLLKYAIIKYDCDLIEMFRSRQNTDKDKIFYVDLLYGIDFALKAFERAEFSKEQLLEFLRKIEMHTVNFGIPPENRLNNLLGLLLFDNWHCPKYLELLKLLLENGFDPFSKDFNGKSLCDRIIDKWKNSSGELNIEYMVTKNRFKEIQTTTELLLMIANNPKASIEQKEFLEKLTAISSYKQTAMDLALSQDEMNVPSVRVLQELGANIDLKDSNGKTALRKAVETSNYEKISQLLKLGASLDDLSGENVTRILYVNHINSIEYYDFEPFIDCLELFYENKKNDGGWINSSKIELAFCIAQGTYGFYDNYLGNKFKRNLFHLIKCFNLSETHWNTKGRNGKTAYDYAKDGRCEELIKEIENIVKGKSSS